MVKGEQIRDVDIAHAIPIGHHERLAPDILTDAGNAPACHGGKPRINDGHLPRLAGRAVNDEVVLSTREVEGDVARLKKVVGKPLLDNMLLVARADDELGEPVVGILLHDMPKDWHTTDLHHRLRAVCALFGDARPRAPGQQDYLHRFH